MRPALLAFAAASLVQGLILALAPGAFYDAIAGFGPRNDHFLRDNAAFYLAAAPALAIAAGRPSWRAPVLALVTLQFVLHALNHLADIGDADPSWVGPFDFASLLLVAVVLGMMLRTALHEEGAR
jgi:hypothetical protein